MPVNTAREEYEFRLPDWQACRDSLQGERAIKAEGATYLPVPPGMNNEGQTYLQGGKKVADTRYSFYKSFAEFPEMISTVLDGFQGIIHGNDPHIELPPKLNYLLDKATVDGKTLLDLWHLMTGEVITTGRLTLLEDVDGKTDQVYFATYSAETLINWRLAEDVLGKPPVMVVLHERYSEPKEGDPFVEESEDRYRELGLAVHPDTGELAYFTQVWAEREMQDQNGKTVTSYVVVEGPDFPSIMGVPFEEIPITVFNHSSIGFEYESIPLLPLVRRALSIYRLTADYKRALYIKCDPQIWIAGVTSEEAPTTIGGSAIWTFPNPQAKAHYLDIDGEGIPLLRDAINNEYERFYQEGGKLLDTAERGAESGEALRRRQVAQQVSLKDITMNLGFEFEKQLKKVAARLGADPEAVKFVPDVDFAEPNITGQELMELMNAVQLGAPLSKQSIHSLQKKGGLTNMTFEQEMGLIAIEGPILPVVTAVQGVDEEEDETVTDG